MIKKVLLSATLFIASINAQELNYALLNKHSFLLPENSSSIKASYLKINDTIDVFNIKDSELGSLARFGSIGDMSGVDLEYRYGLNSKSSLFFNYQRWGVDYLDSTLNNNRLEFFYRRNLVSSEYTALNSLSLDFGYVTNFASRLDVKSDRMLNSMINKVKPNSGYSIQDGDVVKDDVFLSFWNAEGEKVTPYLMIDDLKSSSYYLRAIFAKKFSSRNLLDIYMGYKFTKVNTSLKFYTGGIEDLEEVFDNYDIPNLDRDENSLSLGFVSTVESSGYLYEFNYEFNKIFRDSDLDYRDKNHIVEASISKVINKDLLAFVGGRIMFSQFNTDIPYLYNKYTQSQFDKKYGFARVGLVYSFEL
jgi:hypothetical protein